MKFNGGKKLEKRESIHKLASFDARSDVCSRRQLTTTGSCSIVDTVASICTASHPAIKYYSMLYECTGALLADVTLFDLRSSWISGH